MNPANPVHDEFAGIDEVPAPWTLSGSGLIVLMRSKTDRLLRDERIPAHVRSSLQSKLSVLMYVNYTHSNAGPYRELLYVPGTAQFSEKRLLTISNIVVSSPSSVKNGRINWGIPKNLCNFEVETGPEGIQEISLEQDGVPQFELAYSGKGLNFPMNTALIPKFMKTLGQHWQGKEFIYCPSAKGSARMANVHLLQNLGTAFPDMDIGEVKAAVEITRFQMTFPVPQVRPL